MIDEKKASIYRIVTIAIFILAALLDVFVFSIAISKNKFSWVDLCLLLFDTVVIVLVVYSLFKRNEKLLDIQLLVLKVFDGLYFLFEAMRELDIGIDSRKHAVMFSFFLASSLFLLTSFIFYCIYSYTKKRVYWNIMKYILLFAFVCMVVYGILVIVYKPEKIEVWSKFLEPFSSALLFLGIFCACQFIDYNDETKNS